MAKSVAIHEGLRLIETVEFLPVTFVSDTCSSLPPYEALGCGLTLYVHRVEFCSPDAGPDRVLVYLVTDLRDDSEDLALSLSELVEVTNLSELVELHRTVA
jgi:hypothetical protein